MSRVVSLVGAMLAAWGTAVHAHPSIEEQLAGIEARTGSAPCNTALQAKRAELFGELRRWDDADQALAKAAACDGSGNHGFAMTRARLALDAGRPADAEHLLARFIAAHPDHAPAHLLRARVLKQLGRPRDAADAFARGLAQADAPSPDDYLHYSDALLDAGSAEAAVAALDQGLARLGNVAALQRAAIDIEVERGDTAAALRRIDRLLSGAPGREQWLVRRAEILADAGRVDEARRALEQAAAGLRTRTERRRETRGLREIERTVNERLEQLRPQQSRLPAGADTGAICQMEER